MAENTNIISKHTPNFLTLIAVSNPSILNTIMVPDILPQSFLKIPQNLRRFSQ